MKTRIFSFLFYLISIIYAGSAYALLPPYYQSTKEIMALLDNPEIAEKIGSGRMISSILRTEEGYTITARECTLTVKITYLKPPKGFVGPASFDVHPGAMECKLHPQTR